MSAREALLSFARDVRELEQFAERGAAASAPLVEAAARKTAAAGVDPYGSPWAPKKHGGRPLVNAAEHVHARAVGRFVVLELEGPEVWHEEGAQGKPVRRVIPDVEVPDAIAEAVDQGCARAFDAIMGGA